MRQSYKYGLFLIIALLIHIATIDTVEKICGASYPTHCQEDSRLSLDDRIHNLFEELLQLYAMHCDEMLQGEVAHVPGDKNMLPPVSYLREHRKTSVSSYSHPQNIPSYFYDPITHYIYGLRKIVI